MDVSISFDRLQADIEELAAIGRREDHGIYRMALSDADMQARDWLQTKIRDAGLEVYVDGAANIHGRLDWNGTDASVMTGSHIDSVPGAGFLDGSLGVVAGLECLRRLKELDAKLARPLEVVSFTDEEGRFGAMPGSQAMAGKLTPGTILEARDLSDLTFVEAMKQRGYDAMHALRAMRDPESLHAFVELHIEQGPVLDATSTSIGVVEGIAGLFKWQVRFIGASDHAGATPMNMRKDAFQGLAEVAGEIPRVLEENGSESSVATIGRVQLTPGAANVVPGRADFTLEVRDTNPDVLHELGRAFRQALSAIARRRDLMFEFDVLSEITPVPCDKEIMRIIGEVAEETGQTYRQLPSGAAHDTQQLAAITRVGMIFVPSKGGRSHSPAEWTPWDRIEGGANVLLRTLYRLAT